MRAVLSCALAAAACAHAPASGSPHIETVAVQGSAFRIQYWPRDEAEAGQVRRALAVAVPRAMRWGKLEVPVVVTIHPSHEDLERATRREGHPWLRAWARFANVDFQSPRTWEPFDFIVGAPTDEQVAELLTHELVHCAMYQAIGGEYTWMQRDVPVWFREGMASVAADQGYKRIGLEDIWRFYREAPGAGDGAPGSGQAFADPGGWRDPLTDPESPPVEPLYQRNADLVYGTAHWAFRFLLDRYGEEPVRAILPRLGRGQPFGQAFEAEIGISLRAFERDFRHYVVGQGWRRNP